MLINRLQNLITAAKHALKVLDSECVGIREADAAEVLRKAIKEMEDELA